MFLFNVVVLLVCTARATGDAEEVGGIRENLGTEIKDYEIIELKTKNSIVKTDDKKSDLIEKQEDILIVKTENAILNQVPAKADNTVPESEFEDSGPIQPKTDNNLPESEIEDLDPIEAKTDNTVPESEIIDSSTVQEKTENTVLEREIEDSGRVQANTDNNLPESETIDSDIIQAKTDNTVPETEIKDPIQAKTEPIYIVTTTKPAFTDNTTEPEGPAPLSHNCDAISHPLLSPHCALWLYSHYHHIRGGWRQCNEFGSSYNKRCGLWWAKCKRRKRNLHCCVSVHCNAKLFHGLNLG